MESKKEMAYVLYVNLGLDINTVATRIGVSVNTINKWNRQYKWKEMRSISKLAPARLSAECYLHCTEIVSMAKAESRSINNDEVMRISKLVATANKLDYQLSPGSHMEAFKNFNRYLVQAKPTIVQEVMEFEKDFVRRMIDTNNRQAIKTRD